MPENYQSYDNQQVEDRGDKHSSRFVGNPDLGNDFQGNYELCDIASEIGRPRYASSVLPRIGLPSEVPRAQESVGTL